MNSPGEFGFQPSESEVQPSMSSLHRLIPLCPCHLWEERVRVSFKSFWAWKNKWTHSSVCPNKLVQNVVWKFCTKYYGKERLHSLEESLSPCSVLCFSCARAVVNILKKWGWSRVGWKRCVSGELGRVCFKRKELTWKIVVSGGSSQVKISENDRWGSQLQMA